MSARRPTLIAALWAAVGGVLSIVAAGLAFGSHEARELIIPIAAAAAITIAALPIGSRLLGRASLRSRFVSVAVLTVVIALANLAVLAISMLVADKDAAMVAVLMIYAAAVAIGAGVAVGSTSATAIERISTAARAVAAGDRGARAGAVGGGRELEELATTFDEMAAELAAGEEREHAIEAQRRDLIAAVSHDLRTPLADLRAMAEAIEDRVVSDPDTIHAYAVRMGGSVESLSRLVDDLFEFAQLDAGVIEAGRERAKVCEIVADAVAACDGQAALKGLVLRTDLGNAGEAECSPHLTRVLQNLLANAIRHTPSDGTVVVAARRDEDAIELAVADTGDGIAPEVRDRVFEPFWRGDAARSSPGTGLGLALTKRIVESLGGEIEVESEPAGGSRFAISLPQPS
jgi:signal transduction histidine kinase